MVDVLAFGLPSFGAFELLLIFGVGLLLFGKRLPDIARGAGRSIVEFKRGLRSIEDDVDNPRLPDETTKQTPAPPANPQ